MALLAAYGFDNYASNTELAAEPNWTSDAGLFGTTSGRFGGGAIICGPSSLNTDSWTLAIPNVTTLFFGCSFLFPTFEHFSFAGGKNFMEFREGGSNHTQLQFSTFSRKIEVLRLGASQGNFYLAMHIWHRIEVKLIVDDTVGEMTVRLNGVEVFTQTGVDTKVGANAYTDSIRFIMNQESDADSIVMRWDDVTVNDETGPAPQNTWLGDLRIETLIPDVAGSQSDFTPLASTNVSNVDEVPGADGDTTYVESSTAAHQDLYNITSLQGTQNTIYGLQVTANARKDDAGGRSIILLARENVTTGSGATQALIDSVYTNHHEIFELNPDTAAAWSTAEINAAEIGMENV